MNTADQALEALLEEDTFSVWMPGTVEFSLAKGGDAAKERRIGGFCSTERRDRQDEVVVQKGLDFSEFLAHGWFNDNHKQDIDKVLGYPETAKYIVSKGWKTEGYLLKTPDVDKIWDVAKALEGTPRRFGFSIEGKVLERNESDNKILKARVRNVAITHVPVNTDCTWTILSKAFADASSVSRFDDTYKALMAGQAHPAVGGGRVLEGGPEESSSDEADAKKSFGFDHAVLLLRRLRPEYSWATCERIAKYTITTKENRP